SDRDDALGRDDAGIPRLQRGVAPFRERRAQGLRRRPGPHARPGRTLEHERVHPRSAGESVASRTGWQGSGLASLRQGLDPLTALSVMSSQTLSITEETES